MLDVTSYGWRGHVFNFLYTMNCPPKSVDIYQFGTWTGHSFIELMTLLGKFPFVNHFYGFDSFEGLPNDSIMHKNPNWDIGSFSASKSFCVNNPLEACEQTAKKIMQNSSCPFTLIPGFFKDSLNKNLLTQYNFKPAIYVDIDVDLYDSTVECLSWMIESNLIKPGTLIGYDDWGGTEEYRGGESLAHVSVFDKYNICCKKLLKTDKVGSHQQCIYQVIR